MSKSAKPVRDHSYTRKGLPHPFDPAGKNPGGASQDRKDEGKVETKEPQEK